MSLQAVINPLEFMKSGPAVMGKKVRKANEEFDMSKPIGERQRVAERIRAAMEFRENMAQGIPAAPGMGPGMAMTGGFDASDLMKTPGMIQQSTRDQAEKVSAPYREANMMAADKTNPMNAASQEPGRSFLMKYIGK